MLRLCSDLEEEIEFAPATSMAKRAHAAPSPIHGIGLFASVALDAGTAVTLYPVHAIGDAAHCITYSQDERETDYFGSASMQEYTVDLPVGEGFGLAGWAEDAWVSASPYRLPADGWLGHLVNDAATCDALNGPAVAKYYEEGAKLANAFMVPLGPAPFFCWVTSRPVEAGEELLGVYGHHYWSSADDDDDAGEEIARVADRFAERAFAAHRGVESRYAAQIELLWERVRSCMPAPAG
eukprot:2583701-Prymnesium_polylepis.1